MKGLLIGVLGLVFVMVSGCATLTSGDARSQFFAEMAITTGTMKFIEGSSEPQSYATEAIEIAGYIKEFAQSGQVIPVQDIIQEIHLQIPYDKMELSDKVLAQSLVNLIAMELEAKAETVNLDPDMSIAVTKLADIVIAAASHYAIH